MFIYGINPIVEALHAASVSKVWVGSRRDQRLEQLLEEAERAGVEIQRVERAELDNLARGGVHQGVVARVTKLVDYTVADLVSQATAPSLVLVIDGVEDPQNFGALMRTADAAGVDGVIYQTRRAAPISAATMKASSGAMSHVRLAPVVNISRAVEELKSAGLWSVGLEAGAAHVYSDLELDQPTALVVGAEGKGLRRLVRERCDWLVSIPMHGLVSSLNVSVAVGVVLYEAWRQRMQSTPS